LPRKRPATARMAGQLKPIDSKTSSDPLGLNGESKPRIASRKNQLEMIIVASRKNQLQRFPV